jgi:5-methylcytosine-specific restriction protein A
VRDGAGYCAAHKRAAAGSFADAQRGSRHDRGYGNDWDKRRKRILARDCGLCQECRRQGRLMAVGGKPYTAFVDHIIPKAEGGTDDDGNLETLCRPCHTAKTDKEKNRRR